MASNVPDSISINLTVVRGRDLVAKDRSFIGKRTTSDPFVKVSLLNRFYGQTAVQYKTVSPVWNHQFHISISGEEKIKEALQTSIVLTLWDCDSKTKDDPMGVVMIPCTDFITNSNPYDLTRWYPVQNGAPDKNYYCKNATGEVQVYITVTQHKSVEAPTEKRSDTATRNIAESDEVDVVFNSASSENEEEIVLSLANEMQQCTTNVEPAVSAPVVSDSTEQPDCVLKTSKSTYYQGEMISLEFMYTKSVNVAFRQYDSIYIVLHDTKNANFCNSYLAWTSLLEDAGSASGTKTMKIKGKVGKYKAVLASDHDTKILAVSNIFEVAQNSVVLSVNKSSYNLGERLEVNFSTSCDLPFRENDYIVIVSDATSKSQYNSSYVLWQRLGDEAGATSGSMSIPIKWKSGKYKAVIFLDDGETFFVSDVFEIKPATAVLTSNQSTYEVGQQLELAFSTSADNVPFRENDYITIVSENTTKSEYNSVYVAWENLREEAGTSSGTKSIKIKWKVGKYKAVLFLEGGQTVLAVSNDFQVIQTSTVLKSRHPSYYVGERLELEFSTTGNVPFHESDYITIVSENTTKSEYNSSYVAWQNIGDEAGSSSGTKLVMIKWKPGKYKAVMFLEGAHVIRGMTDLFEIKPAPTVLASKHSSYSVGQILTLEFSSTANIPFRASDYFVIVSENATKQEYETSYVAWQSLGDEAGQSFGEMEIRIQWQIGKYKAVLFLDHGMILAVSNVFQVNET